MLQGEVSAGSFATLVVDLPGFLRRSIVVFAWGYRARFVDIDRGEPVNGHRTCEYPVFMTQSTIEGMFRTVADEVGMHNFVVLKSPTAPVLVAGLRTT
jgi:hypothetical protein